MRSNILGCTVQSRSYSSTHSLYVRSAIDSSQQIGGVILCRRGEGAGRLTAIDLLLHRAPRAECLTGLRAGTPVSCSVYADSFVHRNIAAQPFPLTTLRSPGGRLK